MHRVLPRLRASVSYANVTATLALVIALGGTSYAAIRVTGKNITNNTVSSVDIRNNSLRGKDIRNSTIEGRDVKNGTLTGSDVKNRSLTGIDIKPGTIPLNRLRGTLAPQVAASAPPALAAGSVTADKIAAGAVGADQQSPVPTARVSRTGPLDLPDDALVTVPFDREIDDLFDLHAVNAPGLRAPIPGVYAISAGAWISAHNNGRRYASIVLNGALNIASEAVRPVTGGGAATIMSLATTRRLAPGDIVTLTVLQNSGTTLKLDAGAEHTSLVLTWLGP